YLYISLYIYIYTLSLHDALPIFKDINLYLLIKSSDNHSSISTKLNACSIYLLSCFCFSPSFKRYIGVNVLPPSCLSAITFCPVIICFFCSHFPFTVTVSPITKRFFKYG